MFFFYIFKKKEWATKECQNVLTDLKLVFSDALEYIQIKFGLSMANMSKKSYFSTFKICFYFLY